MNKSDRDGPIEFPISFHPSSNGEFEPRPVTDADRLAAALYRRLVEDSSKRLGVTRRQFTESASGMVAALFVMNQAYGCGGNAARNPAKTGGAGGSAGTGGTGGFSRDAGFDVPDDVSAADAAQAAGDARYDVSEETIEDAGQADQVVAGQEFIFDVQTHNRVPAPPWNANTCTTGAPDLCPTAYLRGIFVGSDTQVACLSGYPAARQNDQPTIQARARIKEIVDRLGGSPRLLIHANGRPDQGAPELDAMSTDAMTFPVAAWKTYPAAVSGRGLDSDTFGRPFVERARQLGIKVIASHRGIGSDGGSWDGLYSPRDVAVAAAANPDVSFLVYHAGWQPGIAEDHPFNMADPAPRGVDRLIKAAIDNGLGPTSNFYAELGSTWFNLMGNMNQAAHVMGKLLKYLGPNRILWGTDSYNNGGPQPQIEAFRAFEIPLSMQALYGYPALTAEVKRKIFGLNAAAAYGVNVQTLRPKLTGDQVDAIILARRGRPRAPAAAPRPHGPRTRREYLAFLRWSGEG